MSELEGKSAIVTGGSRGIGKAIVQALARAGAGVVFTYRSNSEASDALIKELESEGASVMAVQGDVRDADSVKTVVDAAVERFERLDILVNNAGILKEGMLAFTKEEDWDEIIDINLKGSFLFTKAVIRQMARKRFGRIINISSDAALMGDVQRAGYCSAKAGMLGLTRAVARETATQGVTVNAITPGIIETDLIDGMPDAKREAYEQFIPMRRFGSPEDVAGLVVFLASEQAAYITGQVISVDGGLHM